MVKNKKSFLLILILFCITNFKLISQDNNSQNIVDESSIVFSDTTTETGSNNISESDNGHSYLGSFFRMILFLVLVVALIYAFFWFVKKRDKNLKDSDDYLRRVAFINLGQNKSVEIVTLLDKGYLIGVTESNITLLGEINDKELVNAMNVNADKNLNVKKPVNFKELLDTLLVKGDKNNFFNQKNVFEDKK